MNEQDWAIKILLEGTSLSRESEPVIENKYENEIWNGWADFIDRYHWNSWWTFTWREIWSVRSIIKAMRKWGTFFTDYEFKAPSYIFFIEPHASGFPHVHGLTRHEKYSRKRMWEDGFDKFGRCQGLGFRENIGGNYYIAKYCSKTRTEVVLDERIQ